MAKFKKATKKTSKSSAGSKADARAKAERLSKSLSESAQQIWQAGVGAFGRAQEEGSKLFEGLVKEGLNLEQTARKFAGGRAEVVRDVVETGVGQARDRATDTWDRLEKVFEDRVQRALTRLGVPGRDDLSDLSDRVEDLTAELRRRGGASTGKATKKPAKAPAKKTAQKAAAKKAAPKKSARNTVAKPAPVKKAAKAAGVAKKAPTKRAAKAATPRKATTAARTGKTAQPRKPTVAKSIVALPPPVAPAASDD